MNEINIEMDPMPSASGSGNQPAGQPNNNNQSTVDTLKGQVNDVTNTMRLNMERILERDNNLNDLVTQSNTLENASFRFEGQARKIKRKMWWKNLKMSIILFLIFVVLLTAIGVALASYVKSNNSDDSSPKTTTKTTTTTIAPVTTTAATTTVTQPITTAPPATTTTTPITTVTTTTTTPTTTTTTPVTTPDPD